MQIFVEKKRDNELERLYLKKNIRTERCSDSAGSRMLRTVLLRARKTMMRVRLVSLEQPVLFQKLHRQLRAQRSWIPIQQCHISRDLEM
jgi:hypothetical protein